MEDDNVTDNTTKHASDKMQLAYIFGFLTVVYGTVKLLFGLYEASAGLGAELLTIAGGATLMYISYRSADWNDEQGDTQLQN